MLKNRYLAPVSFPAPIAEYGFVPALGAPTLEVGHDAMHVGGNTEAHRPPRRIVVNRQIPPRNPFPATPARKGKVVIDLGALDHKALREMARSLSTRLAESALNIEVFKKELGLELEASERLAKVERDRGLEQALPEMPGASTGGSSSCFP